MDYYSVITLDTYNKQFVHRTIEPTNVKLRTYTGEEVKIHGQISVNVKYKDSEFNLPLLVVDGDGPALLNGKRLVATYTSRLAKFIQHAIQSLHHNKQIQTGFLTRCWGIDRCCYSLFGPSLLR